MAKRAKRPGPRSALPADAQIGKAVRERRIELGRSQTDLAGAVGVTFQQVQKYESGANRISMARLRAIAAQLDTEPETLMGIMREVPDLKASLLTSLSPSGVRLLRAYSRVTDRAVQTEMVRFFEAVADAQ